MESPGTIEARNYAETLKTITDLMPAMPAPSRSRAAWAVARAKASLADAVKAEGFDLHGAPAAAVAPLKRDLAAVVHTVAGHDDLADLQKASDSVQVARLQGRASAATAATVKNLASSKIDEAARALMASRPGLSYLHAAAQATRKNIHM